MKKLEKRSLKPWGKKLDWEEEDTDAEIDEICKFARTRDVPRCTLSGTKHGIKFFSNILIQD